MPYYCSKCGHYVEYAGHPCPTPPPIVTGSTYTTTLEEKCRKLDEEAEYFEFAWADERTAREMAERRIAELEKDNKDLQAVHEAELGVYHACCGEVRELEQRIAALDSRVRALLNVLPGVLELARHAGKADHPAYKAACAALAGKEV